jgi:hypothetical protein
MFKRIRVIRTCVNGEFITRFGHLIFVPTKLYAHPHLHTHTHHVYKIYLILIPIQVSGP